MGKITNLKSLLSIVLCLCSFAVTTIIGHQLFLIKRNFNDLHNKIVTMIPASKDSYLAFFANPVNQHTVDHYVLYHNLKPWVQDAKKAEIIFAGNSKTLYAFDIPKFKELMQPINLNLYNLGFQQAEGWGFTKVLLEKYDLRPKILIINGEEFFPRPPSGFAQYVMSQSRFSAWKSVFEDEMCFNTMISIHRFAYFPYWLTTDGGRAKFRSLTNGSWRWGFKIPGLQPTVFDPNYEWPEKPRQAIISIAKEFKDFLTARDTQLIMTWIPKEIPSNFSEVKAIADANDIPLVTVSNEDLFTFDHDHLHWDSGTLFTERLVAKLKKNTVFMNALMKD
ncbi:MAG: hypothetical protein HQK54_01855 [Oligoflexales bacterium]|nr:hypothetical protein [Oligoflexales bacterium]